MDRPLTMPSESPDDPFALGRAALAALDHKGTVVGWSRNTEELLGHRSDDAIGRPAMDLLVHPSDRQLVGKAVDECARAQGWFGMLPLLRRDGTRTWVALRVRRVARSAGAEEWIMVGAPAGDVARWETDRAILDGLFRRCPIGISVHAPDLSILRANRAIARFGGVPTENLVGRHIGDFVVAEDTATVEETLRQVLDTGRSVMFAEQSCGLLSDPERELIVAVSAFRVEDGTGRVLGVTQMVENVTGLHRARRRLALLNEASVRIGTTLDVARTARELAEVTVPALADVVSVDLLEPVIQGELVPPGATGPLHRMALRSVSPKATAIMHPENDEIFYSPLAPQTRCLQEGRPILVPQLRLSKTWFHSDDERVRHLRESGVHSLMAVPLTARGVVLGMVALWRAPRQEPFEEDDLTLAVEFAARAALFIDNARRYTQQHDAALTLQRSLLPSEVPEQQAVEIAHRYQPANVATGVGGDWFDVIPLSGARVALVVGDVVGHGVPAAATMGRLRTAVHTLAALDLEPEELLSRLDDLVSRLADEREALGSDSEVGEVIGATCLYAVYDPVAGICSISRAGHPPPAVVTPDGQVALAELPAGPPLGLGGVPFESAELRLPEGSLLALYTDGLIEANRQDLDAGVELLCTGLTRPLESLEELCDGIMESVRAYRPTDDIALLVARTRVLAEERVRSWVLEAEPTAAQEARTLTAAQLTEWGLEEMTFTTELVVSELVTNAFRYGGGGSMELRLIRNHSLICEVADHSTTAPHLRRARSTDEGGRGLFLVAQLTERWGARFTREGKTVWTEQTLPDRPESATRRRPPLPRPTGSPLV